MLLAHRRGPDPADNADTGTGTKASVPALPTWTQAQVIKQDGKPFTVSSKGSGPRWRVKATVVGPFIIMDANSLDDVDSTVHHLVRDELVIGLTVLLLMAGFGYWIVRRSLRPLADVEQTAAAIAAGDLSRRVPHRDPRTEVGRLALSVNAMLSQIESAFRVRRDSEQAALASEQRMRRFVTDASHELRTPLTSIRGFAELYRQGAAGSPEDLARLMRRIEDEAARMGAARRRPAAARPAGPAAAAGARDRRPGGRSAPTPCTTPTPWRPTAAITLEVLPGPPPPEIIGDESRLRQVVGNLVTNALTHTPAGTPVTVRVGSRVESTGLHALIEVADQGPGLDEEAVGAGVRAVLPGRPVPQPQPRWYGPRPVDRRGPGRRARRPGRARDGTGQRARRSGCCCRRRPTPS